MGSHPRKADVDWLCAIVETAAIAMAVGYVIAILIMGLAVLAE
jgi:hypothetical protein